MYHASAAGSYRCWISEAEAAGRDPARQKENKWTGAAQSERETRERTATAPAAAIQPKHPKVALRIPTVLAVTAAIIVTVIVLIANSSKTMV